MWFRRLIDWGVTPYRAAIEISVSPRRTTCLTCGIATGFAVAVADVRLGVLAGDGVAVERESAPPTERTDVGDGATGSVSRVAAAKAAAVPGSSLRGSQPSIEPDAAARNNAAVAIASASRSARIKTRRRMLDPRADGCWALTS